VSISVQPLNAAYWAYPTLFIAYFLLPRRQALLLSLLLVAMVSVLMTLGVGPAVAARTFATLALTLVMLNVVLNVIGQLQRTLEEQATTDPLTGAYNRRHLEAQLALLGPPPANASTANVLLALDIDHFKAINDRHGHAAGDAVLQGLVAVIHERKRAGDALFRIGGEEFVLLLPRVVPADASRLAEALRQRVEVATLLPGETVTVCVGVAAQRAGSGPADWLQRADAALYEAKRTGRNRVVQAE
jgi:diguanylate cyclase (GGDEF)-like protein